MKYIMALDQGTTSCRCILFDHSGNICAMAQEGFAQYYPDDGWVEHDAMEIWNCQRRVAQLALVQAGVSAEDIAAIGLTKQRETTVVWDKNTGKPIYHAIVWQCHRTAKYVDSLIQNGYSDMIRNKTGLIPDSYFSGTKIKWILDHVEGARARAERGELLFGTIDTWLIWNLTNGAVHATDPTNASRTMLYDIHHLCWDDELLQLMDIPRAMLPEVRPSSGSFGKTIPSLFGNEIPICGVAGDQQAALFGQCCFQPGEVKNTYGTGCFLLMNTGHTPVASKRGLLTTLAATVGKKPEYALEGSVFIGGAVIQWLRDELHLIDQSSDSEYFASKVKDSAGMYLVPAFTGLGTPYWNPNARGCIVGLTRGSSKAHFIRAALESIAYQTADVCMVMEQESGIPLKKLKVDGGASMNNALLQFQSDILSFNVYRPQCVETTALGAAYLAGLSIGYWRDKKELASSWQAERVFFPEMSELIRAKKKSGWEAAIVCTQTWGNMHKSERI